MACKVPYKLGEAAFSHALEVNTNKWIGQMWLPVNMILTEMHSMSDQMGYRYIEMEMPAWIRPTALLT